jgi:hypothetical protein
MMQSPGDSFKIVYYAARSQDFFGADLHRARRRHRQAVLPSVAPLMLPYFVSAHLKLSPSSANYYRRAVGLRGKIKSPLCPVLLHGAREYFTKTLDDFL